MEIADKLIAVLSKFPFGPLVTPTSFEYETTGFEDPFGGAMKANLVDMKAGDPWSNGNAGARYRACLGIADGRSGLARKQTTGQNK